MVENNEKAFSIVSNLQTHYHFKLHFQIMDQHTGGKWLIYGIKYHKDNQLQSLELPCKNLDRESKHNMNESEGDMFNPIFKNKCQGQKHPERCIAAEPKLLRLRKPTWVGRNVWQWT